MTNPDDEWAWLSPQPPKTGDDSTTEADRTLAICFTRTFGQGEGARVLTHLRTLTKERVLGPETSDNALRYMEGQRGLVAYMEQLIARGRA